MAENQVKDALKMMPYGLYGITSRSGDNVNAMVANWLTQASFEPRLLSLSLQKTSFTYSLVQEGLVFAVNIFLEEDADRLTPFTKSRTKNPEKMKEAVYEPAPETGCPILAGAAAYIECKVIAIHDLGGDHDIVVGEVVAGGIRKEASAADSLSLPDLGWSYAG